jgi:plasmid stabilization system protein ParE
MATINFTNAAKEDSRSIFADLQTKAGAYTVEKYLTEFSRLYDHFSRFPDSGAPRRKLEPTVRIGVVFRMLSFTATSKPTTPCLFSAFYTVAAKSPAACWGSPSLSHEGGHRHGARAF